MCAGFVISALVLECVAQLSDSQRSAILNKHNELRGQVTPSASNMLKMSWNGTLEKIASDHGAKCIWGHNADRTQASNGMFSYVGENIYLQTGTGWTPGSETQNWFDEYVDYTYSSNQCAAGKVCGHYTQVIWAASSLLGCSRTFCQQMTGFNCGSRGCTFVVCNYAPGGNFNFNSASKMYLSGTPCSTCPSSASSCESNLCTAGSAISPTSAPSSAPTTSPSLAPSSSPDTPGSSATPPDQPGNGTSSEPVSPRSSGFQESSFYAFMIMAASIASVLN